MRKIQVLVSNMRVSFGAVENINYYFNISIEKSCFVFENYKQICIFFIFTEKNC